MLARESHATLFETRQVQRDRSSPSTEINLPLDCMVLKGGDWVQELQPGSGFTGILIRDEYKEASRVIVEWFLKGTEATEVTEGTMEVDDMQPAPFGNPFLDLPTGFVSTIRGLLILGNPGIGGQSSSFSFYSRLISNCRENCVLICFTGSTPASSAYNHLSVTKQSSVLFLRQRCLPDPFDFGAHRHRLPVSVPPIDVVFD